MEIDKYLNINEIEKIKNEIIVKYNKINELQKEIINYYDEISKMEIKLKNICKHNIVIEHNFNEKYKYCNICNIYL